MIIRCPHCEHSRSINEDKIPNTAELATCPKCKQRFRFRTLEKPDASIFDKPEQPGGQPHTDYRKSPERKGAMAQAKSASPQNSGRGGPASPPRIRVPSAPPPPKKEEPPFPAQKIERPQSAFREAAEKADADIWDAVDALHQRWQNQMDQHVTEVETPRPSARARASQNHSQEPFPDSASSRPLLSGEARYTQEEHYAQPPRKRVRVAPIPTDNEGTALSAPYEHAEPPARAPVIYGENGVAPEDVVNEDMKMLRGGIENERPLRDLGTLKEFSENAESAADTESEDQTPPVAGAGAHDYYEGLYGPEAGENAVPWENPAQYGWPRAFLNTVYGVMFRGPSFFSSLGKASSLGQCYLFFLILGYIGIFGAVVWSKVAAIFLPELASVLNSEVSILALLIVAPLALGLMQLFVTGCMRLQLKMLAPDRSDFATSYRITAYSVAPFMLSIVPFVGPVLGAGWFIFALVTGCRYALRLSWGLAVAVPLPAAALLIAGMCWYFL